jgi:hypothetical protein
MQYSSCDARFGESAALRNFFFHGNSEAQAVQI